MPHTPSITKFIKHQRGDLEVLNTRIMTFDPGETTGWATFDPSLEKKKVSAGQQNTKTFDPGSIMDLRDMIASFKPDAVVYESYRIYSWKSENHMWSEVHTLQVIGVVRYLCAEMGIPIYFQSAQIAKNFCTDDKLKDWNQWRAGEKHARDALRHLFYFMIFGPSENS